MRAMIKKIRITIRVKLLLSLIPLLFLSFVAFNFLSNYLFFDVMNSILLEQAKVNLNQSTLLFDSEIKKLHMETDNLIFNENVQEFLQIDQKFLSSDVKSQLDKDVVEYMYDIIIDYNYYVNSIAIKNKYDNYYLWKLQQEYAGVYSKDVDKYYEEAKLLDGQLFFSYDRIEDNLITITRVIINPRTFEELGVLMVDLEMSFVDEILSSNADDYIEIAIVHDEAVIYNNTDIDLSKLDNTKNYYTQDGQHYSYQTIEAKNAPLTIIGFINETAVVERTADVRLTQNILIFSTLALIVGLIIFISNKIENQFNTFIKKIKSTNSIEDNSMIIIDSNDEFYDLSVVYNKMLIRIQNLMEEIIQKEIDIKNAQLALKNAEFYTLQAQINPHFLYNTLDCINGLIDLDRKDDTKKTVIALSAIMRQTIKGNEFNSVKNNIEIVELFMFIQKMRYDNRLLFLCEYPEGVINYLMPKLILQPLLENSVIHGLEKVKEKCMIALFVEENEDDLLFHVKDNALGMPDNIIEKLNLPLSELRKMGKIKNSIGLINIQTRLKLLYGEDYGLTVTNHKDKGCTVTVKIPKKEI